MFEVKPKYKRIFSGIILFFIVFLLCYVILLAHPEILVKKRYEYRNFTIYSDEEVPKEIEDVLDDAHKRLKATYLYEDDEFKVFILNNDKLFALFTRNPNAGGVVNAFFGENIFIRESRIKENRLVGPGSWNVTNPEDRPLSYFIAHEAVHGLQQKLTPINSYQKPHYIIEGYADFIAKSTNFDYEDYKLRYLRGGDRAMNPEVSGLYDKYTLYIAYLMDTEGHTYEEILDKEFKLDEILSRLEE